MALGENGSSITQGCGRVTHYRPCCSSLLWSPYKGYFTWQTEDGLLTPINNRAATLRCSLYADDAALFVNPVKEEVKVVADLLNIFGKASGLMINQDKCAVHPVRCEGGLGSSGRHAALSLPSQGFPLHVPRFTSSLQTDQTCRYPASY
jgi:hypothetical protein